jgi:DNA-binding SARP family transcriptional activator
MLGNERPSTCTLRVAICGKLSVETADLVLLERDFPARQGRRLWCYLVLERRHGTSREDLADALWGDDWPDEWDSSLSAVISRIRAMLKPAISQIPDLALVSDDGGYWLQLPETAFVDYDRARYGLHIAETALARHDIATALSEGRVALEIAARGFLPGETLPWVERRRRQLREIEIHAAECIAEAELQRNEPRRAEREAESLLTIDPLNETAFRIRMRAASAMGNRAGVVRSMHQCRQVLRAVAGTTPSDETERLYRRLTGA